MRRPVTAEAHLMLTALGAAKRQKIELKRYSSRAVGHVVKTPEGLRFQEIAAEVTVTVRRDVESVKAVNLVHIAEKYCPISNALKCPFKVFVTVRQG